MFFQGRNKLYNILKIVKNFIHYKVSVQNIGKWCIDKKSKQIRNQFVYNFQVIFH